jgi:hypothetical protein
VLNKELKWLSGFDWQKVVDINRELCQKEGVVYKEGKGYENAHQLWTENQDKPMKLIDALDFCKRLTAIEPFDFINNNTFASVAKAFISDKLNNAPKLPLTMLLNTASHYIVGNAKRREVLEVIGYFEYATGDGEFKPTSQDTAKIIQSESTGSTTRESKPANVPVR